MQDLSIQEIIWMVLSVILAAYGVMKSLAAKKYKADAEKALDVSAIICSVIEAFPVDTMSKEEVKDRIRTMAIRYGLEEKFLASIVDQIQTSIRSRENLDQTAASLAADAVDEFRAARKTSKPRLVLPLLLAALVGLSASGCVSTQGSKDQRTRIETNSKTDAENGVKESGDVNKELLTLKAEKEFGKRLAAYTQGMANAKKLRDAELSAQITTAYLLGMAETRRALDDEAIRLSLIPAKIRALGNAVIVTNRMADDEKSVNEANLKDLINPEMLEALVNTLDTIQKQYTPAEVLVDPKSGKPRENVLPGSTAQELLNQITGVKTTANGHHNETPTHLPAGHHDTSDEIPAGHHDTNHK